MQPINQLTDLFRKLPGIGPRQARRFVYYLLTADQNWLDELSEKIKNLKKEIRQCARCGRYFNNGYRAEASECKICTDPDRDKGSLLIVEKDIDLEAVEKADTYRGFYFVIGGTVPILDPNPESHIRFAPLLKLLDQQLKDGLSEIIIALSATTEGDHTAEWLIEKLRPITSQTNLRISLLGRGLSTGSELEYADAETIKNALTNRH